MAITKEILGINDDLRFVLFGLECALGVEFNASETERVFIDYLNGSWEAKHYLFFERPGLRVVGQVEDHEPETLWLIVDSRKEWQPSLASIVERAHFQVYRQQRFREREEESMDSVNES
ncbi:MAG: hypothetical protein M3Y13_13525 [Armatimonadota bacterium]|nr:hypothetical protein [Armatimonadota bacterium]